MWTGLTELAAAEGREAQTAQDKLLDIAGANEELRDVAAEADRKAAKLVQEVGFLRDAHRQHMEATNEEMDAANEECGQARPEVDRNVDELERQVGAERLRRREAERRADDLERQLAAALPESTRDIDDASLLAAVEPTIEATIVGQGGALETLPERLGLGLHAAAAARDGSDERERKEERDARLLLERQNAQHLAKLGAMEASIKRLQKLCAHKDAALRLLHPSPLSKPISPSRGGPVFLPEAGLSHAPAPGAPASMSPSASALLSSGVVKTPPRRSRPSARPPGPAGPQHPSAAKKNLQNWSNLKNGQTSHEVVFPALGRNTAGRTDPRLPQHRNPYRGTSLIRKRPPFEIPLGP